MATIQATPIKLKNGNWGAKAKSERVQVGDTVTITTASGKSWDARVESVVWTGNGVAICATQSLDGARRAEPTTVSGETAELGQHWSSRGRGPVVRLCAGGCGRRVSPKFAECYSCAKESIDAM